MTDEAQEHPPFRSMTKLQLVNTALDLWTRNDELSRMLADHRAVASNAANEALKVMERRAADADVARDGIAATFEECSDAILMRLGDGYGNLKPDRDDVKMLLDMIERRFCP